MKKLTLLVLAAGLGSRYGSLKQIDQFGPCGETIIDYSVYDAIRAGFGKVVFVIRRSIEEEFKEVFYGKFADKIAIDYVLQELDHVPEGITVPPQREKPWGTGHAVMVAGGKLKEPFAVINADDFYGARSFKLMADFLSTVDPDQEEYGLLGYKLKNTLSEHGYVARGICEVDDAGFLANVTERTHIYVKEKQIVYQAEHGEEGELTGEEIASMNLVGFTPSVFKYFTQYFSEFIEKNYHHPKAEFFLPFVLNEIVKSRQARVKVMLTPEKWFGVTYREDKETAQQKLKALVNEGVYPENLWKSGKMAKIDHNK